MQWVRILLLPLGFLYGILLWIRNIAYDIGVLPTIPSAVPTICIGNLNLGGTGKTPMIEYFIAMLSPYYKIAILSRGYKRNTKGFVLADRRATANSIGDEPYQIYKKFPKVNIGVDANRVNGVIRLKKSVNPDLILLDDAYQHRRIKANIYVLLTTFDKIFIKDYYIPSGTLRDHKKERKRADIIIITKCPKNLLPKDKEYLKKKLRLRSNQHLFFSDIHFFESVKNNHTSLLLEEFLKHPFHLVTGIANPKPLVDYLKAKEACFTHQAFPDHHNFTQKEIDILQKKKYVLTTEKDFVRLPKTLKNVYYIEITHKFSSPMKLEKTVLDMLTPLKRR